MEIDRSDLLKIWDALGAAVKHHKARDQANAALHQAAEIRYSPLTTTLINACDRAAATLNGDPDA